MLGIPRRALRVRSETTSHFHRKQIPNKSNNKDQAQRENATEKSGQSQGFRMSQTDQFECPGDFFHPSNSTPNARGYGSFNLKPMK